MMKLQIKEMQRDIYTTDEVLTHRYETWRACADVSPIAVSLSEYFCYSDNGFFMVPHSATKEALLALRRTHATILRCRSGVVQAS